MLLRLNRSKPFFFQPHTCFHFSNLFSASASPRLPNGTVITISALVKKPNWENSSKLKSLVSHSSPELLYSVLAFNSRDTPLCLKFFKWACNQSTYCYDIEGKIHVLNFLASGNLFSIMHKVLVFLINDCCNSQDDLLKLMNVIEKIRRESGFRINYPCYSTLLMALAKLDMGLTAYFVYKDMVENGFELSGIDYRTIVNALCKNGFVQASEMFVCMISKLGLALDVHIHTSLILGNCRAGKIREAFNVFDKMLKSDGCGVNSVAIAILVHCLCEVGNLDGALKLKDDMNCFSSTRTYTILIKAMCDKGLIDQSFSLLDEMVRKGCKPNVHTYTVLIDMLCRKGKIEEANGLFRKMLKDGYVPSVITYNALINGYCKEGRVLSAFELLGLMERKWCKPNIRTYNELMEGLCKIDRPYKAMALLRKVMENGYFPTVVTFNILIDGFCKACELNIAYRILLFMKCHCVEPDCFSYTPFIDISCKMEQMEQAGSFLGLMIKKGVPLDEITLTTVIHGYFKTGQTRFGLLLLNRTIEEGYVSTPHSLNMLLDVLSKEVNLIQQNAVVGKMLKHAVVPSVVTYTILIDGLCRAGDINSSLKMMDLMKRDGCAPNVYAYGILIRSYCESGKLDEAYNVLIDMQKSTGVFPNATLYGVLIKAYVAAGLLSRAFDAVVTMVRNGCRLNAEICYDLLKGASMTESSRSMDHIFQILNKIRGHGIDTTDLYKFMIMGLCREGRTSEGVLLIEEMIKHGLILDTDLCHSVIMHFYELHDYDHCIEWINRFRDYGCAALSFGCSSRVVVGLRKEGRFEEAEWLMSHILRDSGVENQSLVSKYIEFLVNEEVDGQSFELLNLLDGMECNVTRTCTLIQ